MVILIVYSLENHFKSNIFVLTVFKLRTICVLLSSEVNSNIYYLHDNTSGLRT
eukprot:GAHX01006487.1.p1 GENE.GAHX01006487.1~~GAHX01006487.1.p1  ORF type:complete len:53 (+),score=2.47 GAHX01006487.1:259-417(+)